MGDGWGSVTVPTAPPAPPAPGLVFEPGYGYRPEPGLPAGSVLSAVPCDPALPVPAPHPPSATHTIPITPIT